MAGFKGPLIIEVIGNRMYKLHEPLVYESDNGDVYTVPAGFEVDLASTWGIPVVAEKLDGVGAMSASVHDFCYRTGCVPRKTADDLFWEALYWESTYYQILGNSGISNETRYAFWLGVRVGGGSSYKGKEEWNN
jgi:hypothetical protein